MRVLLSLLVLAFAFQARAGDFAERTIIGFSPDAKLFAFSEHGIQDGSGRPYLSVYVIETENDRWLTGTPIRKVAAAGETTGLSDAAGLALIRAEAMSELDASTNVTEWTYHRAASRSPWQFDGDGQTISGEARPFTPPRRNGPTFRIAATDVAPSSTAEDGPCYDLKKPQRLRIFELNPTGETPRIWHDEDRPPESRGCPSDYRFGDIVTAPRSEPTVAALLVFYETIGFEGPDGRWIAVTGTLR